MTENARKQHPTGDHLLRRDIRLLGWHFRQLVLDDCGEEIWDELHHLRDLAERRQLGDPDAENEIADHLRKLSIDRLELLTRATGMFFDLANLAEDHHRVRVLQQRKEDDNLTETIQLGIEELRGATNSEQFKTLLSRLRIEPVFTAHPTEAKRRTVRRILRRLRRDLYAVDNPNLRGSRRREVLDDMYQNLRALWSTESISARKPTVIEELRRTVYAVRTLWRVGPRILAKVRDSLNSEEERQALNHPLKFGNWIGGDRDGNPFVTADVTKQTLEYLRKNAIEMHRSTCVNVRRRLTLSAARYDFPESLKAAIDAAILKWPNLKEYINTFHPQEWIVQWLTIVDRRLRASAPLPGTNLHIMAYATDQEFQNDIQLVYDALKHAGQDDLASGHLLRWLDRIKIFGLYLLRLDIRVNATTVRKTAAKILAASNASSDYLELKDGDRIHALQSLPPDQAQPLSPFQLDHDAQDLLDVLTLTQQQAHLQNDDAIGHFIVSMTQMPSDILALQWLTDFAAHHAQLPHTIPFRLVPLFETMDDLESAHLLLEKLLTNPDFQQHLAAKEHQMTCMIGYSDSAKDGGYFAANRGLYLAQQNLAISAQKHNIKLTIFHGRGGALGRGGGPAARAIKSLPPEAVNGRLRLTEQGEVIAERYDDPGIAQRHLEQLFWATLWQSVPHESTTPDYADQLADQLAAFSLQAYRNLLQMPGFDQYMRDATALALIEKLRIGSRPTRRSAAAKLEDLRAIPFTFAWNQIRMPINAFFGLGAAYNQLDDESRSRAPELYSNWAWFRAVINNAELALARCDSAIARRYALQSEDPESALKIWQALNDEHAAALNAVLQIKQETQIIEALPWLHRTIQIRNPYLDMLNLTQVELLDRRDNQADEYPPDQLDEALRLTVQAIAAGLRNTG